MGVKQFKNSGEIFNKWVRLCKYYLPVINFVLFAGVISLTIICILLVYYPDGDIPDSEAIYKTNTSAKAEPLLSLNRKPKRTDNYEIIVSNNPFSPYRSPWVIQGPRIKPDIQQQKPDRIPVVINRKRPERKKSADIHLIGTLIIGDIKKALIKNPGQINNRRPFIFVEEGEMIVDYTVKHIEPDQITLDWYGEEQVVTMRSNVRK